jgi:hypothetical protein
MEGKKGGLEWGWRMVSYTHVVVCDGDCVARAAWWACVSLLTVLVGLADCDRTTGNTCMLEKKYYHSKHEGCEPWFNVGEMCCAIEEMCALWMHACLGWTHHMLSARSQPATPVVLKKLAIWGAEPGGYPSK